MRRVLIANRGEIALRVIRACRELQLDTVAVYSSADRDALHARSADDAVCIGKPSARHSYLNASALIDAARQTGADAVHPGYGFLAESAEFARLCEHQGLIWVGPRPETIAQLGNKVAAKRQASDLRIPVVPGTDSTVELDDAMRAATRIGYPVLIKAAAGGGGTGIRVARDPNELATRMPEAAREAHAAFGTPSLYLERHLSNPRHVEVQVLADSYGNVLHLFERDCSIQRRRQKVVEEAPCPALDHQTRREIADCAIRLARATGYVNAGTVEFLLDANGAFYFIEMNTRIQVEHPVTEMLTGIDLVKEQLRVAVGAPLAFTQQDVMQRGVSMEFRITAEDPAADFHPSVGRITRLELPGGPGVRIDTALFTGYSVPPYYDSLVAKLIVWGLDRDEAIMRARRALREFVIDGIMTTIPLHLRILDDPEFRRGNYQTEFLASGILDDKAALRD